MLEGIGLSTNRDSEIIAKRGDYFSKTNLDIEDILTNFPTFTRRVHMTRFLAHYELYKMIKDLPGSIVELGVYKGASLFAFANFLEIFHPGDRSRKAIGFDSFEGLEEPGEKDGENNPTQGKVKGGYSAKHLEQDILFFKDQFIAESFVPQAPRIELVKGNILETVPEYSRKNKGLRISLLHCDCDLYEPTIEGLKHFAPKIVPGGIIAFDEYSIPAWAGESKAVEEYFGREVEIKKFQWSSLPGGFIKLK